MFDWQYAENTYTTHHSTISLIKNGDAYRYGDTGVKDEIKAYSLYNEAEAILSSFEGRCAGMSPYVYSRLCDCYLYGIGTKKNILKALDTFVKFYHYLHHLPFVASVYNKSVDPNCEAMAAYAKKQLDKLNEEIIVAGFAIRLGDNYVRVFSKFRLPFQINSKTQTDYHLLKQAIRNILVYVPRVSVGTILHARYGTTDTKKLFYDLENVLFYNFGFSKDIEVKSTKGICFSEISSSELKKLQIKEGVPEEFCHCYEYFADPKATVPGRNEQLAAYWNPQSFTPINSTKCVFDYWKAMKDFSDKINVLDLVDTNRAETFSMYLKVTIPEDGRIKLMSSLKPFLDAVICAMHGGKFSEEDTLLFANIMHVSQEWISSNALNVLGERTYLHKYPSKTGLKWNPADDLCKKTCISIVRGKEWQLSGEVYRILS